jgi:F420-dependent oxidoreductase-like protein
MIGVLLREPDVARTAERIVAAEQAGVAGVWLTTVGAGRDALTLLAAAAARTSTINLGTAIMPTWPRHPIALAQQAQVVEALAPGRLRIGVGPGSEASMSALVGAQWRDPLGHLREYVTVLKTLLQTGSVDFEGSHFVAHGRISAPIQVPVYASALRAGAFEACGAAADGAITWVAPWRYVEAVGLPALRAGAETAGRPTPELLYHVPVCVHPDRAEALAAAQLELSSYANIPAWAAMFADAGLGPTDGAAFFDSYLVSGNESEVATQLRALLSHGASQLIVDPIIVGEPEASLAATFKALAAAS